MADARSGLNIRIGGDMSGLDNAREKASSGLRAFRALTSDITKDVAANLAEMGASASISGASIRKGLVDVLKAALPTFTSIVQGLYSMRYALVAGAAAFTLFGGARASLEATSVAAKSYIELTDQIGGSVEQWSRMSYAFSATGSSAENFNEIMKTLANNLDKDDVYSPTIRALKALGVVTKDATSTNMTAEQVLMAVADKFAYMENGIGKTTLATALFGEGIKSNMRYLDLTAAQVRQLANEGEGLGSVMRNQVAQDVLAVNRNMSELARISGLTSEQIGQAFVPAVRKVTDVMVTYNKENNVAVHVGGVLRTMLGGLWIAVNALLQPIFAVNEGFKGLVGGMLELANGNIAGAWDKIAGVPAGIAENWKSFKSTVAGTAEYIDPVLGAIARNALAVGKGFDWTPTITKAAPPTMASLEEIRKALEKLRFEARMAMQDMMADKSLSLGDKIAYLTQQVNAGKIGWREYYMQIRAGIQDLSQDNTQEFAAKYIQLNQLLDKRIITTQQFKNATAEANAVQTQLNQSIAQMELNQTLGNNKLPIQEKIEALNEAVLTGKIRFGDYVEMIKKVNDQGTQAMQDLASTTAQALTTIFKDNKTAAIAAAIINTSVAVTKALSAYPPPISFAMAGLQAAMGFAQVRAIQNTNKGSASAPAVSAPSAASAGAASSAAAPAAQNSTLFVQGISPNSLFTGEAVRDLAGRLIQYQRDGGRVILGT